jgi:tetratricopeptide (TPR) repeat protein
MIAYVSRAADPDPWRNRLRGALEGKGLTSLAKLAAAARGDRLPPATVVLLARLTAGTGAAERVVVLLRQARQRHPADFWINHELGYCLSKLRPAQLEEAIRYYTAAVSLRPQSPAAHNNLGLALNDKGRLDEAIACIREAIHLDKDDARTRTNLGWVLSRLGKTDEAIACYRLAIRLKKDSLEAHINLGIALKDKGQLDEAIAAFQEAIRLKKDSAMAHNNLGAALRQKGLLDQAIAECREATRLQEDFAEAHTNLGNMLQGKGRLDEASACYRQAIRFNKDYAGAHYNLGIVLKDKGELDEAIAELREAIRIRKVYPEAYNNLGGVLQTKGRLDEAIACYRQAIRFNKEHAPAHYNLANVLRDKGRLVEAIKEHRKAISIAKDFAEAHCNLGQLLLRTGQFRDAVDAFRRGHQLGSRNSRWPYPSAQWLRQAEQLVRLDERLSAVLAGKATPKDAAERLGFAQLCQQHRQRYAAAARFYSEAFTEQPTLAGQLDAHRYNAACAAARAGIGQGKDTAGQGETERARLRQQALGWLRADLSGWGQLLQKGPEKARPVIAQQMRHWLADPDFAGVRGAEALARLPEAERADWQKLWADVADTLKRATATPAPDRKPQSKEGPAG